VQDVYTLDAWYFRLNEEHRDEHCRGCDLNTNLAPKENPPAEKLKLALSQGSHAERAEIIRNAYHQLIDAADGRLEGEIRDLVDQSSPYLRGVLNVIGDNMEIYLTKPEQQAFVMEYFHSMGAERNGCYRGSSYSHFGTFFDFIAKHGDFSLLTWKYLNSDGGIPIKQLGEFQHELAASRKVLEEQTVPGMLLYDRKGRWMGTVANATDQVYGNETHGYGMGLELDHDAIVVIHKGDYVFTLPRAERAELLKEQGLDVMMQRNAEIRAANPRLLFKEICRDGDRIYGMT